MNAGEQPRLSVFQIVVGDGTEQEDQPGDDSHPVQLRETGTDHVAGELRAGQYMKSSGGFDKSKENNSADPNHQREEHQSAQPTHTGTATLWAISRRIVSACSDFFSVDEYRALTTTRCAKTGTTSVLKSAGVVNMRPSRYAMACAAR